MQKRRNLNYLCALMKKAFFCFLIISLFSLVPFAATSQCSVCTRTTEQMGEKPAGKINAGILYLAAAPLAIAGIIGFRWWKKNHDI
jgi:hypothetical protein